MFKRRTLFVVGAGASYEFGLSLGPALAATIAKKADIKLRDWGESDGSSHDPDIYHQLQRRDRDRINEYVRAARVICDGVQMSASIDDFLDVHGSDEDIKTVGKICIAKAILEEERTSKLWFDKSNIYNKMKVSEFEDTWIIKFVRMLVRGVPKEKVGTIFQNIAFIIFNYDRCIEQCLLHAIQQVYSIKMQDAARILDALTIIHPYGMVGELKTELNGNGVAFGGEYDRLSENYSLLSDRIKTYTEQLGDEHELEAIHEEVRNAERIVFLGFAFHDQNMTLLKPPEPLKRKDIYATAFGMSQSDADVVRAQLLNFFDGPERDIMNGNIDIRPDLKCTDFFDQYTRSLPA
jgi:hypothetical protein